jgi:uncharacterized membrane protein YdjX (TVP38/TMEM64 family)
MSAKEIATILLLGALFVGASIFAQKYANFFEAIPFAQSVLGMALYVAITIVAVVIMPVSTLPILPVAVGFWGSFIAALLSVIGWIVGAIFAFLIARRFGSPVVRRFTNLRNIERFEQVLPEQHVFWGLVFLRITLPVDVLSYAVGLFTKISFKIYLTSTALGIIPFAFIFSYAATMPPHYQLVAGIIGFAVLFIGYQKIKSSMSYQQ